MMFRFDETLIPLLEYKAAGELPDLFTMEDGTPLTQGIGNSYIGICPLKSEVVWE